MKYFKRIIIGIILLEFLNLIIGLVSNGKDVILPYTSFNAPPLYYDMDSSYGVTRQRSTKQMISYPWGGVVCKTNTLGFVDDEFKNDGILITGNSFVEGYGIKAKHRFSEILEKKTSLTINNAGSGGVWTPIQSFMVLRDLLKNKKMAFKQTIIILTPGEVVNLDKRSPKNDLLRNYPYRLNDTLSFHKTEKSSFTNNLSLIDKSKRLFKSLLISKIYYTFKYYGAPKVKPNIVDFEREKLDWFASLIEKENFNSVIDIIILNNLGRIKIKEIENYSNQSKKVKFHLINFPDDLNNYFTSNGHLNKKGNEELAKLMEGLIRK